MSSKRELNPTQKQQPSTFAQTLRQASEQMERRVREYEIHHQHQTNGGGGNVPPDQSYSGPASIDSISNYPVTIDLTGPLPVISVLRDNGHRSIVNNNHRQQSIPNQETSSREKLYHKLIREAPSVPLTNLSRSRHTNNNGNGEPHAVTLSPNNNNNHSSQSRYIDDINPVLVSQGKAFVRKNFFALILAHLVAVAFLLAVKPIQALLLRTGSVHKKENTLKRYLALILCVKNLYECDLVLEKEDDDELNKTSNQAGARDGKTSKGTIYLPNASSKALKELQILRKMQENVAKNFRIYAPPPSDCLKLDEAEDELLSKLKADLSLMTDPDVPDACEVKDLEKIYTTVNPDVPLSQYDMAIVQFTFFGFVSLFPKAFGIYLNEGDADEGLKGFVHLWAIFGKRLGLEDRFNLCLERNYDPETNMKIFKEIFLFSFKLADETLIKLWRSMTSRSSRYFNFFRTKSLIQFMLKNVANIANPKNVFSCMNFWERTSYHLYDFGVKWVLRFWVPRMMLNGIVKGIIFLGYKFYLRRMKKEKYMIQSSLISIRINDEDNDSRNDDGLETIS